MRGRAMEVVTSLYYIANIVAYLIEIIKEQRYLKFFDLVMFILVHKKFVS